MQDDLTGTRPADTGGAPGPDSGRRRASAPTGIARDLRLESAMPDHLADDAAADAAAIAELARAGVDLSRPVLIEFAVDAPNDAVAQAVARALTEGGYAARVEYDEGEPDDDGEIDPDDEEFGPAWTVYTDRQMVPTLAELARVQGEIERIAAPLGGRTDGWGVLIDA
jgi:hypothetical protein